MNLDKAQAYLPPPGPDWAIHADLNPTHQLIVHGCPEKLRGSAAVWQSECQSVTQSGAWRKSGERRRLMTGEFRRRRLGELELAFCAIQLP